ncbi:hypothetical protein JQC67_01735 [Aurantibacter crassamenti]|uniref:hypothetical protein n=1 Tax=Aurantibacter crassamenti TaxID=1837375 RepID=UPI001939D189|nr:hypothetical protein [Aurantibacter crassamenti]MBM1104847.1 hypothetical protein [Aurantibacter crassamenti]
MKKCVIVFILLMSMISAMAQEPAKMPEVIEMHDVVMAKMPKLVKYINKLQTASQNSADKSKYNLAIEDLKSANMSMQKWMEGFGSRFDVDEMMKGKELTSKKQEWLDEEMTKIKALDKKVDSSFKMTEVLLKK